MRIQKCLIFSSLSLFLLMPPHTHSMSTLLPSLSKAVPLKKVSPKIALSKSKYTPKSSWQIKKMQKPYVPAFKRHYSTSISHTEKDKNIHPKQDVNEDVSVIELSRETQAKIDWDKDLKEIEENCFVTLRKVDDFLIAEGEETQISTFPQKFESIFDNFEPYVIRDSFVLAWHNRDLVQHFNNTSLSFIEEMVKAEKFIKNLNDVSLKEKWMEMLGKGTEKLRHKIKKLHEGLAL